MGVAHEQVEEIALASLQIELLALAAKVLVSVNHIGEVDAASNHILVFQPTQIHAVAQFVLLWRGFCAEAAGRGEVEWAASHVGVTVALERLVGATTQAHCGAFKIAN